MVKSGRSQSKGASVEVERRRGASGLKPYHRGVMGGEMRTPGEKDFGPRGTAFTTTRTGSYGDQCDTN
eukprot:30858-Pelagococcus_subviridis.AAC.3